MLLKINLQLKLSVHQKRDFYCLLGITLTIILIQSMIKICIIVLGQSWLLMETSVVNPNKERLFLEIRNRVGVPLILTTVFRSENVAPDKPALKQTFKWPIIQKKFQNNFSNFK